jgi:hypothetical protein
MADIFEAREVWSIALPGMGRVFLHEHNLLRGGKPVTCRKCGAAIEGGKGCRFKQERFGAGATGNGFLCPVCIKRALQETPRWQFNEIECTLFKAFGYTQKPLDGVRLADLWILNGEAGLLAGIREAVEESKLIMKKG